MIKKCEEITTLIFVLEEERVYDWDRAREGTSGVVDNVLFLDLDGDFRYMCLVILY